MSTSSAPRADPAEIRRRHVLRFPLPQGKHFIFRTQRDASLDPCDGLSHRSHSCTRPWQYERSTSIEDHQCYLCQSLLTQQAGACGLWPLGMTLSLRCRSHRVVRYGLLLAILPDCLSFHLQGPHIVCPCTEPFDGFRSTFGQSSGFTTDSPAPESTVISRAPTSLAICFNRFIVNRHVADRDCIQVHPARPPIFITDFLHMITVSRSRRF